ncbi:hypothetical protein GCM10010495_69720 [Kitasatospora herbaricolor]|uniref:hypothetical protein n=1 Tax=Kitasatospora herbaricolor TaxID=68217 RepID=UPI00174AEB21|nr:hypothetical protein [Kitasatospora herbaricolor]MDQ0313313.1 hypothetical protein [Kitasatospora herbaricolor]GGV42115.1 hypothetical protein GCM10010495_69720 [Kitasatospora herbaricolor]
MTYLTITVTTWLLWVLLTLTFVAAMWIRAIRRPGRWIQRIRPTHTRHLVSAHRIRSTLRLHGVPLDHLPTCDAMARRSTTFGSQTLGVLLTWIVPFLLILAALATSPPPAFNGWVIAVVYAMLTVTTVLAVADARAAARGSIFAATTRAAMDVVELLGAGEEAARRAQYHQSLTQALSTPINSLCQAALTQAAVLSARTDPHTRAKILSNAQHLVTNLKGERSRLLQQPHNSKARIAQLCAAVLTQATLPHESELCPALVVDPAVLATELDWRPARSPRRHIALTITVQTTMIATLIGTVIVLTQLQVPEAVVLLIFALLATLFARILHALKLPATDWLRISRR